jgi:uncharacterized circularly permuted ATP-grasp superfamily protein/uncharacterized alpha-E superfamily protein
LPPGAIARDEMVDGAGGLRAHWRGVLGAYAALTDELPERARRLDRAVAEEGVAALLPSAEAPAPHWRCDPLPLPLPAGEFAALAAGLDQRARLLEAVLADLLGEQRLLAEGLVPPALVFANPAFLRSCRDLAPGVRLHFYAADLIRAPDGAWTVASDRTDGAGGLGLARENRRLLARVLPEPFRPVQVRPLRPFFEWWQESLHRLAPPGRANPAVAFLTEGAAHRHWFEHLLLARELGAALVEPGDLTVRNGAVFLKTLRGLQPVDVLVRRIPGPVLDPLELEGGPLAGVPGLLDAAREGRVRIVNDPASGMVEARGFAPLLPALAERLLGEALTLANATPGVPGSVAPTLVDARLEPRPVVLRLFLVHDGEGWRAMPGGLARVPEGDTEEPGGVLPLGGLAKDVWVLAEDRTDLIGLAPAAVPPLELRRTAGELPSRVADNLFWLGRMVERIERAARLVRAAVARVMRGGATLPRETAELDCLLRCLIEARVLPPEIAGATASPSVLAGALAGSVRERGAIGRAFAEIARLIESVRDRLTGDMYATFTATLRAARDETAAAGRNLDALGHALAAVQRFSALVAGLAAENMVRGGGWLFLDLGRRVERAQSVTAEAAAALDQPSPRIEIGLRLLLELCDSVIAYRSRYLTVVQPAPVLDLVLADPGNPRGLAFQLGAMHTLLDELSGDVGGAERLAATAAGLLAEAEALVGGVLAAQDQAAAAAALPPRLQAIGAELAALSDRMTRRYFALLPAAQALWGEAPAA